MKATILFFLLLQLSSAQADAVQYSFNFEITSDQYAGSLSGPLFTSGTLGTGLVTFEYQPMSAGTVIAPGVSASYVGAPFYVDIEYGSETLRLIDSSFPDPYGRRGIIVQDIPNTDVTYDSILFEGSSGVVSVPDTTGAGQTLQLHTQLGLFAPSSVITDYALSAQNVTAIADNLIQTSFNIQAAGGQVNGRVSDFQLNPVTQIPEPTIFSLLSAGLIVLLYSRQLFTRQGNALRPNPSFEATATGKPASAPQLKR